MLGASHAHDAFTINDNHVHLDLIFASGSGPGFSLRALLIHVDGRFAATAWVYGCMGGGGSCFPAVARLNDALAVVCDYPESGYPKENPFVIVRRIAPEAGA